MKKALCLISETHDPWFNLATEDWIFRDLNPQQQILFLWRNEKTVVIGRNQNPWAECDLKKMSESGIKLVRRQSGGGAVFQDLGNTNFTFLSGRTNYDRKRNFQIVINALKKFGINAETSGRNDLIVNGKKISGSAFKENPDRAFHHGTLLINVNLGELAQYLTPSQKKLIAKGTTSVKSRVTNLSEFNSKLSHDNLSEAIIEEFFKTYGEEKEIEKLDHNTLKKIPQLNTYYEQLKSDDWSFGETPNFQHELSERFEWGMVDLHLNSEKGKITRAKIFSDALDTQLIEELEAHLNHGINYDSQSISQKISELSEKLPHHATNLSQLSDWIKEEIA